MHRWTTTPKKLYAAMCHSPQGFRLSLSPLQSAVGCPSYIVISRFPTTFLFRPYWLNFCYWLCNPCSIFLTVLTCVIIIIMMMIIITGWRHGQKTHVTIFTWSHTIPTSNDVNTILFSVISVASENWIMAFHGEKHALPTFSKYTTNLHSQQSFP